jgi:hypothetical protein
MTNVLPKLHSSSTFRFLTIQINYIQFTMRQKSRFQVPFAHDTTFTSRLFPLYTEPINTTVNEQSIVHSSPLTF